MKVLSAIIYSLVATCAIHDNGITIGVQYVEPDTGAVFEIHTAK